MALRTSTAMARWISTWRITEKTRSCEVEGRFRSADINGKPQVTGRQGKRLKIIDGLPLNWGEPDVLYLNDGKGIF